MNVDKKAFEMAKKLNKFLQQSNVIGVVGGTERAEEASKQQHQQVLSLIDFCLVENFGVCNQFKDSRLLSINMPTYNAVFDSSGEQLASEIAGKHLYLSGGFIANKATALAMSGILPKDINEISIEELIATSIVPVTFDIASLEVQKGDYDVSREAFRKGRGRNWTLKVVDPEARYFLPMAGKYIQLEQEKVRKYIKAWTPSATGTDWIIDFGVLAKVPHPTDHDELEAIGVWGCHKWGTFVLNAAMMLAHEMPTIKTRVIGINETMSFLYDVVIAENLKHYEMIVAVLNRQIVSEEFTRELIIAPVGIFEVL